MTHFTMDPLTLVRDGHVYKIRHEGDGQFSIYESGQLVDMFDAADALMDMAGDALETGA